MSPVIGANTGDHKRNNTDAHMFRGARHIMNEISTSKHLTPAKTRVKDGSLD